MFFSLLYTDRYVIYLCIQDKERESVVYIRVVGSREPQMQIYQQFSRFLYINHPLRELMDKTPLDYGPIFSDTATKEWQ